MQTVEIPIAAAADDGCARYTHNAWPPNAGSFVAEDGIDMFVTKTNSGGNYFGNVTLLRFDTSAIPDDATITAAVLKVYVWAKADNNNLDLVGDYYDFGGEPTVAGDWIETASPAILTVDLAAISTGGVNNLPLTDLSGINKSGFTGIRLTLSAGVPGLGDNNTLGMSSFEDTLQEPRLEVTYTVPEPEPRVPRVTMYVS